MKTLKSFLKHLRVTPIYAGIFENKEDVFGNFSVPVDDTVKICFAVYEYEDYAGSAFVLYYDTKTKNYYEVSGGHCSCYGLEDQWEPDEVNLVALENRIREGHFWDGNILKEAFLKFLE